MKHSTTNLLKLLQDGNQKIKLSQLDVRASKTQDDLILATISQKGYVKADISKINQLGHGIMAITLKNGIQFYT